MNKLIALSTALLLGTTTMAAIASPDGYGPRHDRMEKRIERMTEQLNLTTEQQAQIKTMFEEHKDERKAMRERMHKDINAVLNEEQQSRFKAFREQRHMKRMARHDDKYCEHGKGKGGAYRE